jgi:hypothetical protein
MNPYIDDGYTFFKRVVIGSLIYDVEYRPVLYDERLALIRRSAGSVEAHQKRDRELLEKRVVSIDGAPLEPGKLPKVRPELASRCIDLIMGYEPEDEMRDLKT